MNDYPHKLVSNLITKQKRKNTTPSPEELVQTFFESVQRMQQFNSYAVLPYIKGPTEPLRRTLEKHDIKVFTKPIKTLQHEFPSLIYRSPTMEEQTNVIYKIPCKNLCHAIYM